MVMRILFPLRIIDSSVANIHKSFSFVRCFQEKFFFVKRYFELDRKIYPEKKDFRLIKREKDLQRSLI